ASRSSPRPRPRRAPVAARRSRRARSSAGSADGSADEDERARMSAEPRRCPGCGAETPRSEARFCEQCGAALAPPEPPPFAAPPPDPFGDLPARWNAVRVHPELTQLLATAPEVPELA